MSEEQVIPDPSPAPAPAPAPADADAPAADAPRGPSAADWMEQSAEALAARKRADAEGAERLRDYRRSRGVPTGKIAPDPGLPPAEVLARDRAARDARKEAARVAEEQRRERNKAQGRPPGKM